MGSQGTPTLCICYGWRNVFEPLSQQSKASYYNQAALTIEAFRKRENNQLCIHNNKKAPSICLVCISYIGTDGINSLHNKRTTDIGSKSTSLSPSFLPHRVEKEERALT